MAVSRGVVVCSSGRSALQDRIVVWNFGRRVRRTVLRPCGGVDVVERRISGQSSMRFVVGVRT